MGLRYAEAIAAVEAFNAGSCEVRFVTPILSVCLASQAARGAKGSSPSINFAGDSDSYARNTGLSDAMRGCWKPTMTSGGLLGVSYSPLNQLARAVDVERCNSVINTLFRHRLAGRLASGICKVVGELHDNVASHARGAGFSAAQVYGGSELTFAIADSGCGLLTNAKRVGGATTDAEAIVWAFGKGNTSARKVADPWAQRWAPGTSDPQVDDGAEENAHQGLGLYQLEQLVMQSGGSLWVSSGAAQRLMRDGAWQGECSDSPVRWQGLAIEVCLPLESGLKSPTPYTEGLGDLASELGLDD